MRHAGTRLYAQQLAISPTTYCGTCGIPFVNFCISAVVRYSPIGAMSAAMRPAPRLLAQVRFPMEGNLLTCNLLLFVTATFLLDMYFLPVAVVLSGGVKQVTTLPWHFTPKGALFGPIYGIYVG